MNLNRKKEIVKVKLNKFVKILSNLLFKKALCYMVYAISISILIKITIDVNLYISVL
ncbi:hypothetical protein PIT23_000600 [Clostridioides difficile]|nr:hypothetical protein [Clostridioides difficile]MDI3114465.1 hypothetical protein [Clostridioides difficile]